MGKNIRKQKLPDGELIPLIYDFMFTSIFNKEENLIITENFLANYFNILLEEIRGNVTILSRELGLENKHAANKQVDLLLKLKDKKINIEVSTQLSMGIVNRNVIFACNTHSTSYKHGDRDYNHIENTVQINLVYDPDYIVGEEFRESYYLTNAKGKILTEKFRIDYVNIACLEKKCYTINEDNMVDFCKMLITRKKEEFVKLMGEIMMEEKAKEKLEAEVIKYSQDEEVIALYSDYTKEELERNTLLNDAREEAIRRGLEQGLEQGLQQGLEQGLEQGKLEIAKNLLKLDVDIKVIMSATGLSKEQIEELK